MRALFNSESHGDFYRSTGVVVSVLIACVWQKHHLVWTSRTPLAWPSLHAHHHADRFLTNFWHFWKMSKTECSDVRGTENRVSVVFSGWGLPELGFPKVVKNWRNSRILADFGHFVRGRKTKLAPKNP